MGAAITEKLATAARTKKTIACPFRSGERHPSNCICMGIGKVKACEDCQASGWDASRNNVCKQCHGNGALAVAE